MKSFRQTALLTGLVLTTPVLFGFSVHMFFVSRTVGHEEITRQAIVLTKDLLAKNNADVNDELLKQMTNIKKLPLGMEAIDLDFTDKIGLFQAKNPIIFGNFAADKPNNEEWQTEFNTNIYKRNGFTEGENLLKWGGARSFHFTLNEYIEGSQTPTVAGTTVAPTYQYQTGQVACQDARNYIIDYSNYAMEALAVREGTKKSINPLSKKSKIRKANLRAALFRIGVATHIIQDSFSPSHTFRSPHGGAEALSPETPELKNYNVIDVCYYDQILPHSFETAKEYAANLIMQDTTDDDKPDREKLIIPPYLRLEASRDQNKPCTHGKVDKNDNAWISTAVQVNLINENPWNEWDKKIFERVAKGKQSQIDKLNDLEIQEYCNTNRYKSSEFSAFTCLKHEARLARAATMKYFLVLLDHVKNMRDEGIAFESPEAQDALVESLYDNFFHGSNSKYTDYGLNEIMPNGVMKCDEIKTPMYKKTVSDETFDVLTI